MPVRQPLGAVLKVAVSGILGAMLANPQKETPIGANKAEERRIAHP